MISTLCNAALTVPISAGPQTSIDMSADILANGWEEEEKTCAKLRLRRYTTFCEISDSFKDNPTSL